MRQVNTPHLFDRLLPIARMAGEAILDMYAAGAVQVQHKQDGSPVTAADRAAHRVLAGALAPLLPDCPVVSEEDEASLQHRRATGRFWLIDPLDGSKEFIARNGEFTVNIALVEDGRSVLGVVCAPVLDALYWGGVGLGAQRSVRGEVAPLHAPPMPTDGPRAVVASKSHLDAQTRGWIARLGEVELVQAGSSLKFCRVAEGRAQLYPRLAPTCEWDTAAAQAVLEGAGGAVLDMQGQHLRYGKTDVRNPAFIAVCDSDWKQFLEWE